MHGGKERGEDDRRKEDGTLEDDKRKNGGRSLKERGGRRE